LQKTFILASHRKKIEQMTHEIFPFIHLGIARTGQIFIKKDFRI
jgi:hypothetical protein